MEKKNAQTLKAILDLIGEGKYPEAFTLLSKDKEPLFHDYPKRTLMLAFELSKALNEPAMGQKLIAELAELPYVDQETEELFRELPKKLANRPEEKIGISLEEALKYLSSPEPADLMKGLRYAKEHPLAFPSLRLPLRELCRTKAPFPYRQLALQILSINHDKEMIEFAYLERKLTCVPAELPAISEARRVAKALHELEGKEDAGVSETAKEIILSCLSAYYPFPLPEGDLKEAATALARVYLGQKADLPPLAKRLDSALKSQSPC